MEIPDSCAIPIEQLLSPRTVVARDLPRIDTAVRECQDAAPMSPWARTARQRALDALESWAFDVREPAFDVRALAAPLSVPLWACLVFPVALLTVVPLLGFADPWTAQVEVADAVEVLRKQEKVCKVLRRIERNRVAQQADCETELRLLVVQLEAYQRSAVAVHLEGRALSDRWQRQQHEHLERRARAHLAAQPALLEARARAVRARRDVQRLLRNASQRMVDARRAVQRAQDRCLHPPLYFAVVAQCQVLCGVLVLGLLAVSHCLRFAKRAAYEDVAGESCAPSLWTYAWLGYGVFCVCVEVFVGRRALCELLLGELAPDYVDVVLVEFERVWSMMC